MEDFAAKCASGELKYKQMPVLCCPNGMNLTQSNAIVRYIGKTHCGMKGEMLYPCNSCPELMHAIDETLEQSTDFLNAYIGLVFPGAPSYKDRAANIPIFLSEKLPKHL